jgi:murein L,D-transpeptidase YcbB/YkuD
MERRKQWARLVSIVAGLTAAAVTSAAWSQASNEASAPSAIRQIIDAGQHPDLKWGAFPYYRDEMQVLYGSAARPFWFRDGKALPQAGQAIALIQDAGNRGLDPEDYDADYLASTWRDLQAGKDLDPDALARFDTALSLDLFRLISDLHIGRITPRKVGVGFDVGPKKYDLPALVRDAVQGNHIVATVDAAEPHLALYRRLGQALVTYRRIAAGPEMRTVRVQATVKPGEPFANAPILAYRLAAFGDLDAAAAEKVDGTYSEPLVAAVRRFQGRHGLAADGVLGKATGAAIDVPPSQRVRQIELALERLRWLPELPDGPFLAVNLPAFQVWGFDSLNTTGRPSLAMRIVVGKALDTRTPVFEENMQYVVFRPYWNVPPSIIRGELVPALRASSSALDKRDMELVRGYDDAKTLPVTADNIDQLARGKLLVRQRPGPRNSLGLAKFIFPNANNIYMHGTPSQALFERARRDFSHGCIRLEDPAKMAAFVLRDQPEWTPDRIAAAMAGAQPTRVGLVRPIPVIIFYTTCAVDLEGVVHFYDDIYKHDARLDEELQTGYAYQP